MHRSTARGILINVTGSSDCACRKSTSFHDHQQRAEDANIIFGAVLDED